MAKPAHRPRLPDHKRKMSVSIRISAWVLAEIEELGLLVGPTLEESVVNYLKLREPRVK